MDNSRDSLLDEMADALVSLDKSKAVTLADRVIEEGFDLHEAIESGFGKGIRRAGDLWERGDFFLPELMMSAEIMKTVTDKLLPHFTSGSLERKSAGKIIIGTVQGDIHDIGKTLVSSMLQATGFDVIDLGADVHLDRFVDTAVTQNAHMICMSALLTTTMLGQKSVIESLVERGLRDKFLVMVGGSPVTRQWADDIGANGYASNAVAAVSMARSLLSRDM